MTNADLTVPGRAALTDVHALKWAAGALIVGAISFNALLCFLNTRGIAIGAAHVMASEVLLISAVLIAVRNYLSTANILLIGLIVLVTIIFAMIRYGSGAAEGFDPKISRDLIIPVVFFLLGRAVNDLGAADDIVFASVAIVMVFAIFEYLALDSFLKVFGVAEYYIARGTLEPTSWAMEVSQGLMVSGLRPTDQGRILLPSLGGHRISSLFLEPSTLGNFGVLVAVWAMLRSLMVRKLYLWCGLAGIALIILSDTRFNAYFLAFGLVILLLPPRLTTPGVLILPFVTILGLLLLAASAEHMSGIPEVDGRELYDRLLYSGRVLLDFDIYNWLGLAPSRAQTFDSGYGYIISAVGILGFIALWFFFISLEGASRYYSAFRNVMAVYFVALLCISSSQFTIKIAALIWFLLGILLMARGPGYGKSVERQTAAVGNTKPSAFARSTN